VIKTHSSPSRDVCELLSVSFVRRASFVSGTKDIGAEEKPWKKSSLLDVNSSFYFLFFKSFLFFSFLVPLQQLRNEIIKFGKMNLFLNTT